MKTLLPDSTIRKRNRQNGLDLLGHMLSCSLDVVFLCLALIGGASIRSQFGRMILHACIVSTFGMEGFLQILVFGKIREQIFLLFTKFLLFNKLFKVLSVLNHFGQCVSVYRFTIKWKTKYG